MVVGTATERLKRQRVAVFVRDASRALIRCAGACEGVRCTALASTSAALQATTGGRGARAMMDWPCPVVVARCSFGSVPGAWREKSRDGGESITACVCLSALLGVGISTSNWSSHTSSPLLTSLTSRVCKKSNAGRSFFPAGGWYYLMLRWLVVLSVSKSERSGCLSHGGAVVS